MWPSTRCERSVRARSLRIGLGSESTRAHAYTKERRLPSPLSIYGTVSRTTARNGPFSHGAKNGRRRRRRRRRTRSDVRGMRPRLSHGRRRRRQCVRLRSNVRRGSAAVVQHFSPPGAAAAAAQWTRLDETVSSVPNVFSRTGTTRYPVRAAAAISPEWYTMTEYNSVCSPPHLQSAVTPAGVVTGSRTCNTTL